MKPLRVLLALGLAPAAVLYLTGCGDSRSVSSNSTPPATEKVAAPTGKVVEISMRGNATSFFFEPKEVTVQRGDTVRWKLVDGAPHNVSFFNQPVPDGAKVILENQGKLIGAFLQIPGQHADITFDSKYPLGEYTYVCDPHAPLGMKAKITLVQ